MNILITLDYELYLGGKTGTPENCLIRPMNELCKVADKYGFKYVIFVDAAYLLRLKQLKGYHSQLSVNYDVVINHIKRLSGQGHDIQLHFHPQWLYSVYDDNAGWELQRLPYKLSDMEETDAFSLFHEAKELLDGIIGYKTYAFRAGGYCLTSFPKYKILFEREGVTIDSSVVRNGYVQTPIHAYDYRKIPVKNIYRFSDDVCVEQKDGQFIEMPISAVNWSGLFYALKVRPQMMASYTPSIIYGDGDGISDGNNKRGVTGKLLKFVKPYHNAVSIDGIRSGQLNIIYQQALRKKTNTIIIIGHPKAATDASIRNLDKFLSLNEEFTVCTTRDINKLI